MSEKRPTHFQKRNSRGEPVLFCRSNENIWGFDTTTIKERVTCPQCKKDLEKQNGER